MAHKMDDVRICLEQCNRALERMGSSKRLEIHVQRDGGKGSRRLAWSDNRLIGGRGTIEDMYRALDALSSVLVTISYELEG